MSNRKIQVYESVLHQWMRVTTPRDHETVAKQAGISVRTLRRLAYNEVKDPKHNTAHKIAAAIEEWAKTPLAPIVTVEDIVYPRKIKI